MRVAIVHDWLTGMRGGEKCLEAACRLFPDAELHTLVHARGSTSPAIERMDIRTSFLQRIPGAVRHYRWTLPAIPQAVRRLRPSSGVDVVLSFSSCAAKAVPVPAGALHVCYCHTPMRYAWHLKDQYFRPIHRFSPLGYAREHFLARLRAWDRATAEGVDEFVANSRTVARRIAECYDRSSTVISPPVDVDYFTPDRRVAREDFYLVLSALVPYKRVELATAACQRLDRPLTIIGAGPLGARLARSAGPRTRFLGWQPQPVVRDHLRRCKALLFPTLEDFGIVPLEAGACGAPVIAFKGGGAAETLVEGTPATPGTALFFKEQSVDGLCEALVRFERAPVAVSAELARFRAERYSVAVFERELFRFITRALDRQKPVVRVRPETLSRRAA